MTICHFADLVEQLNSYLGHLPGLIECPKAIYSTKRIKPFDEAGLSQLLLHMCHPKWQNQFNLIQGFIPQNLRSTIEILENIKQFQESTKIPGKPNRKPEENGKSNDKKHKNSVKDKCIPKKGCTSKNCTSARNMGMQP